MAGGSRIGGAGCWPKDLSGPGLAPQDSASPALGEELIRLTTFRGPWGDPDFGALVVLSGKRPQSWPGKAPVHGLYRELRETSEHCRALASRQELLRPMSGSSLCGGRSGPDGPAQRPGPQHARVIVNGVTVQGGTVGADVTPTPRRPTFDRGPVWGCGGQRVLLLCVQLQNTF